MQNKATVEDFLKAFDDYESIVLSDPELIDDDLADLGLNDTERIQLALDDADALLKSFYVKALPIGRAVLKSAWRRDQLIIARHLLDTVKARQPVKDAYLEVLERAKQACELEDNIALTDEEAIELGIARKNTGKLRLSSGKRIFTRETLENYRQGDLFYR